MVVFSGGFANSSTSKLCVFLLSGFPIAAVASRGGELSHACNALAPKACLGNFPLLGRNKCSADQEPSIAVNPGGGAQVAVPWVAVPRWQCPGGCAGASDEEQDKPQAAARQG